MQLGSNTISDGVSQQLFSFDHLEGVIWSPITATTDPPLVLLGHGGGQHKLARGIEARARRYVTNCGFAVVAIDAPGHGDRPRTSQDTDSATAIRRQMSAGEPAALSIARRNSEISMRAVPEWQATLSELEKSGLISAGCSIGYWGVSMGSATGIRLAACEPRIVAAIFGIAGDEVLAKVAARITIPVEFLLQWDDELVPRNSALELFEAFASAEKTLHANPGRHVEIPFFELDSSERFFLRHLAKR